MQYQTEHLELGTDFEEPVCAGTLRLLDDQVEFLEQTLQVELPEPIRVSWYRNSDDLEGCSSEVAGCWNRVDVRSDWRALSHELVHAVTGETWGEASPMFAEGLASALTGEVLLYTGEEHLKEIVREETLTNSQYERSGHFVRWLVDEYGIAALEEAYTSADRRGDPESEQRDALESTYGLPPDELFQRYREEAPAHYRGLGPFSCESEPLPWSGDEWIQELSVDCAEEHTFSRIAQSPEGEMWRRTAVEVPASGSYTLHVDGGAAIVVHCLDENTDSPPPLVVNVPSYSGTLRVIGLFPWLGWPGDKIDDHGDDWPVYLRAGLNIVWVGVKEFEPGRVRVSLKKSELSTP